MTDAGKEPDDIDTRPLMGFMHDIRRIPCAKQSLQYGIVAGVAMGFTSWFRHRIPVRTIDVGVKMFAFVSLASFAACRYDFRQRRADVKRTMQFNYMRPKTFGERVDKSENAAGIQPGYLRGEPQEETPDKGESE